MEEKSEFEKISVRKADKREFAIIAASEGRTQVDVFADMLKLYKAVSIKKSPTTKKIKTVSVAEVINTHNPIVA